ncbi:two-component system response regulator [Terasakiella sp. SH-1]|uniref:response regulator n=1 Tax=Terasakiella sp. SH-1 TaxID=2560057 RepID=UPI0010730C72|nr:two-component system response regulator [Terasakiella sp. SH-1]
MKQTVLVVDDTPLNIDLLKDALGDEYKVIAATSGVTAIKLACGKQMPDLILLDVMMPQIDGYEVCETLKKNPLTAKIPVIFVTALEKVEDEEKGLMLGAVDYITKPIRPAIVRARVATHLALYDQNRTLEKQVSQRTEELEQTRLEVIHRLGQAAEYRDNETGLHVIRMSHYSRLLAEALNFPKHVVDLVFHAAPMHDVGKIGVPDSILLKPGKLSDEEWAIMREHPAIGAKILGEESSELMRASHDIAIAHHEKWDGSGYPYNLKGEDIPLFGRIIAVADVFDALTTARPYKKAWAVKDAVQFINEQSGQHFDPQLVGLFNNLIDEICKIKTKYEETIEFA